MTTDQDKTHCCMCALTQEESPREFMRWLGKVYCSDCFWASDQTARDAFVEAVLDYMAQNDKPDDQSDKTP